MNLDHMLRRAALKDAVAGTGTKDLAPVRQGAEDLEKVLACPKCGHEGPELEFEGTEEAPGDPVEDFEGAEQGMPPPVPRKRGY